MRVKVVPIREVKCNFCHQWMDFPTYLPKSLFICSSCVSTYKNGATVYDPAGNPLRVVFTSLPFSNSTEEKYPMDSQTCTNSRLCLQEIDNNQILRKCASTNIGFSSFQREEDEISNYRSQIMDKIDIGSNGTNLLTAKRNTMGYNQSKTVNEAKKYEFYYPSNEIEQYKVSSTKPIIQRLFGSDMKETLTPETTFSSEQLFLDLKNNKRITIKSNRSSTSIEQTENVLKIKEQVLKVKIDSYLQTRYQSTSLQRILASNIKEAYHSTSIQPKMISLVSFDLGSVDLSCYLSLLDPDFQGTLKLINVLLKDQHMNALLEWVRTTRVERLVLTCNKITDQSLPLLLSKAFPYLKEIYLGRNRINRYRMKENISELRSKFTLYL